MGGQGCPGPVAVIVGAENSRVHHPPLRLWPARTPPLGRRGRFTRRQLCVPPLPLPPPDPRLCPAHLRLRTSQCRRPPRHVCPRRGLVKPSLVKSPGQYDNTQ